MRKNHKRSASEYWQEYIKFAPLLIKDWAKKENSYLKKNIKKNSIVLDVGCGFGRNIEVITPIVQKIVGIDNNKKTSRATKERLSKLKNVEIFFENAEKTHFIKNTFDYVICMGNTFGNFGKNKIKVLKEMKRVAKKDGKIIISVYSEKALSVRMKGYKRIGLKISKIQDGIIFTEQGFILEQFTQEKLKRIFRRVDLKFKTIKINPISYLYEARVRVEK